MTEISQNQFLEKCFKIIQTDSFFLSDEYNTVEEMTTPADGRFRLSEYGLYTMNNILSDFENNKVLSKKLAKNLLIIQNLFSQYSFDKWGYLHDEIIVELYPDSFSLFDKKEWILDILDDYTSSLVRNFYSVV